MAKESRKVYDYDPDRVRETLVKSFQSRGMMATIADLAGLTGLPLNQIKAELPAVVDEYDGRLKVTDSGEILYSFPRGMRSQYKGLGPTLKKLWKSIKKGALAAFKLGFKIWIMLMLVGYFVIFIVLLLVAMAVSMGGSIGGGSSDHRDSHGSSSGRSVGIGGIYLTSRLFDSFVRLWFYSELFRQPQPQRGGYGRPYGSPYGSDSALSEVKPRKPLYKSIYSFVFGDGDPNAHWDEIEKKSVLAFLQSHKGIITMPEFIAITGLKPDEAEHAINRYLLEFEGSPEVTDNGVIYYSFPNLLTRVNRTPEVDGSTIALKKLGRFSSNEPKLNKIFNWINVFNLAFGGYYLYNAFSVGNAFYSVTVDGIALRGGLSYLYSTTAYLLKSFGVANPASGIAWGLGFVPLVFSVLFWIIPAVRSGRLKAQNETIKFENLRRIVARKVASAKTWFKPKEVQVSIEEAKPADPNAVDKIAEELAAWSNAEVSEDGYLFKEIILTQDEAEKLRAKTDLEKFAPGKTVFDTDAQNYGVEGS
ncbi:MAG: hypothetical protein ABFC74_03000 [Rectinema sp.]